MLHVDNFRGVKRYRRSTAHFTLKQAGVEVVEENGGGSGVRMRRVYEH